MFNSLFKTIFKPQQRVSVSHELAMQRLQSHIDALEAERHSLFSLSENPFSIVTLKFSSDWGSTATPNLVFASNNVAHTLGATPDVLAQNPLLILEYLTPADARRIKRHWQVSVKRLQPFSELICIALHGDAHWLQVQITPARRGKLLMWECFALDVTALHNDHEAQKKMLRDQLISLASLSVHTRMRLNKITTNIRQMQQEADGNKEISLAQIGQSCAQLTGALDEVVDTAALALDKVKLANDEFSLAPWLESLVQTWQLQAADRALTFSLDLDNCAHVVHTDRRRLGLVLRRLFLSTIATALPGEVQVRVACQAKAQRLHATLAISSVHKKTASGLDSRSLINAYDDVVTFSPTLTWTQQMARRLGGSVGTSSTKDGKFSLQLRICLPLAQAPVQIEASAKPPLALPALMRDDAMTR
jgi:signal transduction histidine kinase